MKNIRKCVWALYILMLVAAVWAGVNFLYGAFVVDGELLSVFQGIGFIFAVVDAEQYETPFGTYDGLIHALVGVLYVVFLICIIRRIVELISCCRESFNRYIEGEDAALALQHALGIHIKLHFSVFLLFNIFALLLECECTAYTYGLFIFDALILLASMFVNGMVRVTNTPLAKNYSIFNTVRAPLMISLLIYALHILRNAPMLQLILSNIRLISLMDTAEISNRYVLFCYYSYIFEPIVFLIAIVSLLYLIHRTTKDFENSVDTYNCFATAFRRYLIIAGIVLVCRIVLTVYCGYEMQKFAWSEMLLRNVYSIIKKDLLPFMFAIAGAMILNYGMPAVEYTTQKRVLKVCF